MIMSKAGPVGFKPINVEVKRCSRIRLKNKDLKTLFENLRELGIEPLRMENPQTRKVYGDVKKAMAAVVDHVARFLTSKGFGEVKIEVSPSSIEVTTRPGLSTETLAALIVPLGRGQKGKDAVNSFLKRLWELKENRDKK